MTTGRTAASCDRARKRTRADDRPRWRPRTRGTRPTARPTARPWTLVLLNARAMDELAADLVLELAATVRRRVGPASYKKVRRAGSYDPDRLRTGAGWRRVVQVLVNDNK